MVSKPASAARLFERRGRRFENQRAQRPFLQHISFTGFRRAQQAFFNINVLGDPASAARLFWFRYFGDAARAACLSSEVLFCNALF